MAADRDKLELTLTNKDCGLCSFADDVQRFCEQLGLEEELIFKLTLALDELLSNAAAYGYCDQLEHGILVRLKVEAGEMTVRIEDDAEPFDLTQVPPPELDAPIERRKRPVGGMGIHLVRSIMDRVEYRRDSGRNIVTMSKRIHPPLGGV